MKMTGKPSVPVQVLAKRQYGGAVAEDGVITEIITPARYTRGAVQRRILSLSDECKRLLAESGAAKALLPLLLSRKDAIRWTARQVTLPSWQ